MMDYLELFNASYSRVLEFSDEKKNFLDRFYEIFLAKSEAIADLFDRTHMSAQKTMLQDSLFYMRDFYLHRTTNEYMQRIAEVHSKSKKNIAPELYDIWLDSLVEAVREYDPQFNGDIELSWRIALSPGITYMKFMYDNL